MSNFQSILMSLVTGFAVVGATHYLGYDRDTVVDAAALVALVVWCVA